MVYTDLQESTGICMGGRVEQVLAGERLHWPQDHDRDLYRIVRGASARRRAELRIRFVGTAAALRQHF